MTKPSPKLLRAIELFDDYTAEKRRLQQILQSFHDIAGSLDRALSSRSMDAIAAEQKEFLIQEKKLHLQTDHFDRTLAQYRKSLTAAKELVKKSAQVSIRGRKYLITRKGHDLAIQMA